MKTLLFALVVLAGLAAAAGYTGLYNVAADDPHWSVTQRALQLVRQRSIEKRATDVTPPGDLGDARRVLGGAGEYAEMCQSCHLAPGVEDTELRRGLNPKPPGLAHVRLDPREAFWIVKHGVKMTGMPAWGATHSDEVLWNIVAFLERLPHLDAKGYRDLVAKAPMHEEAASGAHAHASDMSPHTAIDAVD